MKIIAIGDIHGKTIWRDIVEKEKDCDTVVFVGDYFDSLEGYSATEQIHNFREIVHYKNTSGKKVIMMRGNHDCHYLWEWPDYERYSGYQNLYENDIRETLRENKDHLQMAYLDVDTLFTHAGVTKQWCKNHNIEVNDNIDKQINELFLKDILPFTFDGNDPYGDNITQSCIWVRPKSLFKDTVDVRQVFGHTQMKQIIPISINENKDRLWDIDCLHGRQYLCIEDGIFSVKVLE